MDKKHNLAYLRAKRKVEMLKGFYNHLAAYILVNTVLILYFSNFFSSEKTDFSNWSNYVTAIFWGIGLQWHALYVLFVLKVKNNFIKRWEEKKIKQFLEEYDDEPEI